jgi:hypothetical protein
MGPEPSALAGRPGSGMGGQEDRPGRRGRTHLALRLAGGGLLIAAGAIRLDLYGVMEVAAFAALTGLVAMPARRGRADSGLLARLRTGAPGTGRAVSASVAVVSVAALAVLSASLACVTFRRWGLCEALISGFAAGGGRARALILACRVGWWP